jgi:hypothetical protein
LAKNSPYLTILLEIEVILGSKMIAQLVNLQYGKVGKMDLAEALFKLLYDEPTEPVTIECDDGEIIEITDKMIQVTIQGDTKTFLRLLDQSVTL